MHIKTFTKFNSLGINTTRITTLGDYGTDTQHTINML